MGAGREVTVSLDGLTDKNIMQVEELNTKLFCVCYDDDYYADALASGEFTKLGTMLLNHVLDLFSKQNILEITLHVQTNNEYAINLYKKFGFKITDTIEKYYRDITPPVDCYVLKKFINQA